MAVKPLQGIKVADFGWVFAGPLMSKYLGDMGATVVKIEGRTRPDSERVRHPYKDEVPGLNRALHFNQHNTSKFSLCVNLGKPDGIRLAREVVGWADVVVENYAGGAMKRMGLCYDELKKVNPDIIMLSACMQGQTGPHANHPGFGHQLTALCGFHNIVGWADRRPVHFGSYTDFMAVPFGVLAIISALDYRRRTGKGQYIDMSQYEVGTQFMSPLMLDFEINNRIAKRKGNLYDYAVPHMAYRCKGEARWCAIAVFNDEEWKSFCSLIGNPAWSNDAKFSTFQKRKETEDELDKLVEEWTINFTAEEVMRLMQSAGVAAGVVQTAKDVLEYDPQLKHRGFTVQLTHPEMGSYRVHRPPFLMSNSSFELRAAPLLGEHNEYVCKEILGKSDEQIAELVINGVLE